MDETQEIAEQFKKIHISILSATTSYLNEKKTRSLKFWLRVTEACLYNLNEFSTDDFERLLSLLKVNILKDVAVATDIRNIKTLLTIKNHQRNQVFNHQYQSTYRGNSYNSELNVYQEQIAKEYKIMHDRMHNALTQNAAETKKIMKLLFHLRVIENYLCNLNGFEMNDFERLVAMACGEFYQLIRNSGIPHNEEEKYVKRDTKRIKTLKKKYKRLYKKHDKLEISYQVKPVAINSNYERNLPIKIPDWSKTEKVNETVRLFHNKYATKQTDEKAKIDFQNLLADIENYLKEEKLCNRVEFTGSVYEHVNISGDTLEFDVMFVKTTRSVRVENKIPGYVKLKTNSEETDNEEINEKWLTGIHLDPKKYADFFYGRIVMFLNKRPDKGYLTINQTYHGVACQIDIMKNGKIWFQVDLVPCIEIDEVLYVPKPPTSTILEWRISHSLEEKENVKNLDGKNECRKQVIRITKALFKLRTSGLFKEFTSYCIKTIAFKLKGNSPGISWNDGNLGECVFYFLKVIKQSLASRHLMHYFETKINLLQNVDINMCAQMEQTLENILKSEIKFLEKFSVAE